MARTAFLAGIGASGALAAVAQFAPTVAPADPAVFFLEYAAVGAGAATVTYLADRS